MRQKVPSGFLLMCMTYKDEVKDETKSSNSELQGAKTLLEAPRVAEEFGVNVTVHMRPSH